MEKLYVREVKCKYRKLKTSINKLSSPNDVWQFLQPKIGDDCQESFYVLGMDNKNIMVYFSIVSVGTATESIVHPREVFSSAIRERVSGIIVSHNHPSGNSTPSRQDIETTKRLREAGKILGIPLMDHIIITVDSYYSMKENGYM